MNSLLIVADEGWESGRIRLVGPRAGGVYGTHQFQEGQEIHVAKLGGDKGIARVVRFSSDLIELDLVSCAPSLALRPIDLVVGLSRPQTLKKVIQAATMAGVRSLHFVHTESGEKSYLTSHVLQPDALQLEVIKSLEQIGEGLYPTVHVHRSFRYFVSHHLPALGAEQPGVRLIASPNSNGLTTAQLEMSYRSMVLAVGSEAGWSEAEVAALCTQGFEKVGLGQRVVRVEVALLMLLGQALLWRFE
jgi:16S rRNA (uracil1498-N3)-methyltransferase